ncbi:hypothetical protein CRG98_025004 [Punica granatum]|nr:hypothetical protein CRG98_025004 [Punica granatum]
MGIDPVTHEPLYKDDQVSPQDQTVCRPDAEQVKLDVGTNGDFLLPALSCENSSNCSPTENSSNDGCQSLDQSNDPDDPLMRYIWSEAFLDDSAWNFMQGTSSTDEFSICGLSSSEDNASWLLSCKSFEEERFLVDCFVGDMDMNMLETGGK